MEKIWKVQNNNEGYECPYCGESDLMHWHEVAKVSEDETTYTCNFRDEWIGADTSVLEDVCKKDLEGNCVFPKCSRICAKFNCGAVLRRCRECGEEYYSPSGCWQMGHDKPKKCKCI